jgi:hypothetical protein
VRPGTNCRKRLSISTSLDPGRNFAEMWVPLNNYRQATQIPTLPQWALPKRTRAGTMHPASGPRPATVRRGPIGQKTTARAEGFQRIPGGAIYGEILWRIAHAKRANEIPNAQLQADMAEAMERPRAASTKQVPSSNRSVTPASSPSWTSCASSPWRPFRDSKR